jgi:hypothetical protein
VRTNSFVECGPSVREDIPPESPSIQAERNSEDGRGKASSSELVRSLSHRAVVGIIEGNSDARPPVAFFVESIQCHDVGYLAKHVEVITEGTLRNEESAFTGLTRPVGHDSVISKYQALASDAEPRDTRDSLRGQSVLNPCLD